MKLQQLRTFLAVAEHRSIHAAARALFVSQPAVTRTMRELERDLDAELLRRSVSGVELTSAGQAFRVRANLLVEDMRRAREELMSMKAGAQGKVAAALTSTVGLTLLWPALTAFQSSMPMARVSLTEDSVPVALRKLQDGTLDFIIANTLPDSLASEFLCTPLFKMTLLVAARQQHPLANACSITELGSQLWLVPGYAFNLDFVSQLFSSEGLDPPQRILECESFAIAAHLLTRMDVFGLFSNAVFDQELAPRQVVKVPLRERFPLVDVSIVTLARSHSTPAARHLMDCLLAQPLPAGTRRGTD